MNVTLAGSNIWQSGEQVTEYAVSPDGASGLMGYNPADPDEFSLNSIRSRAIDAQLSATYGHLLTQAFQAKKREAVGAAFNQKST